VTPATVLAFASAALAVGAGWDLLSSLDGPAVARVLAPLRETGRDGAVPSAGERRRLALLASGCLAAAGWLLSGPLAAALSAASGPLAGLSLVRARQRRHAARVADGAADTARALAAALTAGHSIRTALADAGASVPGAAGHELRRAAHALDLGETTDVVLDGLRRRARSPAWDTLVAAIGIQRTAGGDLAGLLRDLATSLDAAARSRRDARTATAQSRMTAWIVVALPAGATVLAELGSPGFVAGLLATPLSAALVVAAITLQAMAALVVRRLARGVTA